MDNRLDSGALAREHPLVLAGTASSKFAAEGNSATRLVLVSHPAARREGVAYASVAPVQPTPQPDLAFFNERYFPPSIGLNVQEVERLSKLLRDRLVSVSPDLALRAASPPPTINESQLFALLEVPDRNAELLDGRTTAVIPFVAPEHSPVDLWYSDAWN